MDIRDVIYELRTELFHVKRRLAIVESLAKFDRRDSHAGASLEVRTCSCVREAAAAALLEEDPDELLRSVDTLGPQSQPSSLSPQERSSRGLY